MQKEYLQVAVIRLPRVEEALMRRVLAPRHLARLLMPKVVVQRQLKTFHTLKANRAKQMALPLMQRDIIRKRALLAHTLKEITLKL
jgi:hypothetical protein